MRFVNQLLLLSVAATGLCLAQTAPVIQTAFARETLVAGTATAGSGKITIVNVQFPAETQIGTGTVNRDGSFGVSVKTPLVEGHALVAVDQAGRRSARFNVVKARSGGAPGMPPAR